MNINISCAFAKNYDYLKTILKGGGDSFNKMLNFEVMIAFVKRFPNTKMSEEKHLKCSICQTEKTSRITDREADR